MFNNNLKRNHANHEKCNIAIKQTSKLSAASLRVSDYEKSATAAPTNSRWRGPTSAAL